MEHRAATIEPARYVEGESLLIGNQRRGGVVVFVSTSASPSPLLLKRSAREIWRTLDSIRSAASLPGRVDTWRQVDSVVRASGISPLYELAKDGVDLSSDAGSSLRLK